MPAPETFSSSRLFSAQETINAAEFLKLEQKEDIFYDNAAVLLGLSEEEIKKHKSP